MSQDENLLDFQGPHPQANGTAETDQSIGEISSVGEQLQEYAPDPALAAQPVAVPSQTAATVQVQQPAALPLVPPVPIVSAVLPATGSPIKQTPRRRHFSGL